MQLSEVDLLPIPVQHLPLIREAIDTLGITSVLESFLPQDPRSVVSDSDCVTVMLMNVLHGRVALYRMGEWLEHADRDVLLWESCPSTAFSDDRLGACLDHIFDVGVDRVMGDVVSHVLSHPLTPTRYSVHQDTTSLVLFGAYSPGLAPDESDDAEGIPLPAHGYSKDRRPDLKHRSTAGSCTA